MTIQNRATGQVFIGGGDREPVSRTIGGKMRYFGLIRGQRTGPIFDAYTKAIQAATEVEQIKRGLANDPALTPQGQLERLREVSLPFFTEKARFKKDAERLRERLAKQAKKVLALNGYDTATNLQHARLIEAWRAMGPQDKALALQPDRLRQNPDFARALIAENALVTGLEAPERERIQASLLTPEDEDVLREVDQGLKDLQAAERAYNTATQVVAEFAEFNAGHLQMLEAQAEAGALPSREDVEEPQTLAQGKRVKLTVEEDDETEGETDSGRTEHAA